MRGILWLEGGRHPKHADPVSMSLTNHRSHNIGEFTKPLSNGLTVLEKGRHPAHANPVCVVVGRGRVASAALVVTSACLDAIEQVCGCRMCVMM